MQGDSESQRQRHRDTDTDTDTDTGKGRHRDRGRHRIRDRDTETKLEAEVQTETEPYVEVNMQRHGGESGGVAVASMARVSSSTSVNNMSQPAGCVMDPQTDGSYQATRTDY